MSHAPDPLVLTIKIDHVAQSFYEDLRRRYFPPDRNVISAHLTAFHQLRDEKRTHEVLREAAGAASISVLRRPQLRSIGRGVATFFESEPLLALHAELSSTFQGDLIPQDRQRFSPHIVIQNKVEPATARQTLIELQASPLLEPHAIGLTLWRYRGGPWDHLLDFLFATNLQDPGAQ